MPARSCSMSTSRIGFSLRIVVTGIDCGTRSTALRSVAFASSRSSSASGWMAAAVAGVQAHEGGRGIAGEDRQARIPGRRQVDRLIQGVI